MKIGEKSNMVGLVLWCLLLIVLASPQKPQYNGGVIQNPELNEGLKGWSTFGDAKIEHRTLGNNKFIVANSRVHPHDSVSQNLNLEKNRIYTFSAWIQVSKGRIPVSAVFKTQTGHILAGSIFAESSCWSMLKGGFTVLLQALLNSISRDGDSTPAKYLQKLRDIKAFPGNGNLKLGIGLESHFSSAAPNLAYMRASIDTLAATNFPIWVTELDVQTGPYQAQYLEQILREAHSHPKVAGIVIWSAWKPQGCYTMCLTDNNFKNLPTGNVVDELLAGRIAIKSSAGRTDGNGFFEASLSHGLYSVKIHHPSAKNSSLVQKLNVVSSTGADNQTLLMRFAA
ncbi:hypothetical protein GH714_010557 [Hevea brasiliensis]|uniref:GH10 domain-containing protein n=1 Tax=Hevea brasiliensis TaxID=3981 RepID=A0A6A6L0Z0_HEVBR|nr:hypothetical protein GH714_010557 [Hevea brasiliensis]